MISNNSAAHPAGIWQRVCWRVIQNRLVFCGCVNVWHAARLHSCLYYRMVSVSSVSKTHTHHTTPVLDTKTVLSTNWFLRLCINQCVFPPLTKTFLIQIRLGLAWLQLLFLALSLNTPRFEIVRLLLSYRSNRAESIHTHSAVIQAVVQRPAVVHVDVHSWCRWGHEVKHEGSGVVRNGLGISTHLTDLFHMMYTHPNILKWLSRAG